MALVLETGHSPQNENEISRLWSVFELLRKISVSEGLQFTITRALKLHTFVATIKGLFFTTQNPWGPLFNTQKLAALNLYPLALIVNKPQLGQVTRCRSVFVKFIHRHIQSRKTPSLKGRGRIISCNYRIQLKRWVLDQWRGKESFSNLDAASSSLQRWRIQNRRLLCHKNRWCGATQATSTRRCFIPFCSKGILKGKI